MPAKSEKQARYFRLVRAVQKGDVSPKKVSDKLRKTAHNISTKAARDFTKIKEIVNRLKEAEYSVSKMRSVEGKTFDQLLNENTGIPFDKQELLTFQNKQTGFGGFGKVNFIHKKSSNELNVEVFSNETTKSYVFKKLKNNQNEDMYNYACFVEIRGASQGSDKPKIIYALSTIFNQPDEQKSKILADFIDRINSYGL
jgi:hypothetical protein